MAAARREGHQPLNGPLARIGKIFQLAALLALPCAIWAGEIRHSESEAIGLFAGSVAVFALGAGLRALASR